MKITLALLLLGFAVFAVQAAPENFEDILSDYNSQTSPVKNLALEFEIQLKSAIHLGAIAHPLMVEKAVLIATVLLADVSGDGRASMVKVLRGYNAELLENVSETGPFYNLQELNKYFQFLSATLSRSADLESDLEYLKQNLDEVYYETLDFALAVVEIVEKNPAVQNAQTNETLHYALQVIYKLALISPREMQSEMSIRFGKSRLVQNFLRKASVGVENKTVEERYSFLVGEKNDTKFLLENFGGDTLLAQKIKAKIPRLIQRSAH